MMAVQISETREVPLPLPALIKFFFSPSFPTSLCFSPAPSYFRYYCYSKNPDVIVKLDLETLNIQN